MLKTALIVIAVVIVAVLGFAATRPDSFVVQRATRIQAPPEKIFALLSDFLQWPAWSPWEKLDPGMKRTHSGAPQGVGAIYAWEGNSKVGAGRMEIIGAQAPSKLSIQLDFIRPFEGHNLTEYTLQTQGNITDVTWAMSGPSPFISKLMGLVVSMDKMIGKDFEAGLANLKAMAEKP